MRLQNNKIDDFIKTIDKEKSIYGALVYGPDDGLVNIRFKEIAKKIVPNLNDNFNIVNLTEKQVSEEPSIIVDEFLSISMLGDRKLITIKDIGNIREKSSNDNTKKKGGIIGSLEEINSLSNTSNNNFLLISAGDLDTKSSLRKLFELSNNLAAIPCYTDDIAKISQIISTNLRENGFKFTPDIVEFFANNCSNNRMIILNELEKLSIYMGDKKELTIDDIKNCIVSGKEADIGDLINEFCNLNESKILSLLENIRENNEDIVIIRSFISYFLKLQLIKYQLQNGKELTSDFLRLEHKIFWKQEDSIKKHLKIWNSKDILIILESLITLEKEYKSSKLDNKILLENYIFSTVEEFK